MSSSVGSNYENNNRALLLQEHVKRDAKIREDWETMKQLLQDRGELEEQLQAMQQEEVQIGERQVELLENTNRLRDEVRKIKRGQSENGMVDKIYKILAGLLIVGVVTSGIVFTVLYI